MALSEEAGGDAGAAGAEVMDRRKFLAAAAAASFLKPSLAERRLGRVIRVRMDHTKIVDRFKFMAPKGD